MSEWIPYYRRYVAELDDKNKVKNVIVVDNKDFDKHTKDLKYKWKETFKNRPDKNLAVKESEYIEVQDNFLNKKPSETAILDKKTLTWVVPFKEVVDDIKN